MPHRSGKTMKPKSNYISPQQFNQIIDNVPELHIRKWKDKDVQMSMKIAYYCALRYGAEVSDRTKEDFDFDRKELYLGKTKTKKEDYGAIPEFFIPELQAYLDTKKKGEPILKDCDAQNMYKWLMKLGDMLQIEAFLTPQSITGEKTKLHIFRKSFLKEMAFGDFDKKAHLGQIQAHARHDDLAQTVRYLKLNIEGSKEYFENRKKPASLD